MYPDSLKEQAVRAVKAGLSKRKVSSLLKVSRASIDEWIGTVALSEVPAHPHHYILENGGSNRTVGICKVCFCTTEYLNEHDPKHLNRKQVKQ